MDSTEQSEPTELRDTVRVFLSAGVVVALVLSGAALITAVSASGPSSPGAAQTAGNPTKGAAETITVEATEWAFEPADVELAVGTHVVELVNEGEVLHDITFEDGTSVEAEPGQTATVEVDVPAGGLSFFCSIPGHRESGMEGRVTATGATAAEGEPAGSSPPATVPAKTPGVEEISRHPSDLPTHADYTLYRDGRYQQPVERTGPVVQEVHFDIVETVAEVLPGTTMSYWTFDGTVPGPMLRARVGDTIDFYLHNPDDSSMPHNVDFHAVTGPGGGAEHLDTAPGATSNLRVKVLKPGIYIYHCAFPDVPTHIAQGMYGLIVVEPEGGLPEVDHEYYIMQSEFYTDRGGSQSAAQLEDAGHLAFSGENGNLEQPTFVTFNGRPNAVIGDRALGVFTDEAIQTGDTARLFVGNIGPNLISSFHVIGEIFDTVYVEGSFDLTNHNIQTTLVPSGGATGVEMTFEVPGEYLMVDHAIFRTHKGAAGTISVEGDDRPDIFEPVTHSSGLRGGGHS